MSIANIHAALDGAITALAGSLPPIVQENKAISVTGTSEFVRTTLIPARPNQLTIGASGVDELIGLYQIDLYYPTASGHVVPSQKADLIVQAFPRNTTFNTASGLLRVKQCWVDGARSLDKWYVVSVTVSWAMIK